jgi:hypothetical protein
MGGLGKFVHWVQRVIGRGGSCHMSEMMLDRNASMYKHRAFAPNPKMQPMVFLRTSSPHSPTNLPHYSRIRTNTPI